jgi:hypothetical protein
VSVVVVAAAVCGPVASDAANKMAATAIRDNTEAVLVNEGSLSDVISSQLLLDFCYYWWLLLCACSHYVASVFL